ncbi:MAG: hypothetical protein ACYDCC_15100 [Actinomycetota bacterium]
MGEVNSVITLNGYARLAGLGLPSQAVDILSDGNLVFSATTDSAGNFSAPTSLPAGTHELIAVVYRGKTGIESQSASISILVRSWFHVVVTVAGSGIGKVVSSTGTIQCPVYCTESFLSDAPITLTETPDSQSAFSGWSGACSGTQSTCAPTGAPGTLNVTATFNDVVPPPMPRITGVSPSSPSNNNAPTISGTSARRSARWTAPSIHLRECKFQPHDVLDGCGHDYVRNVASLHAGPAPGTTSCGPHRV